MESIQIIESTKVWTEEENFDRYCLQHQEPYRSTVKLFEWIESINEGGGLDRGNPFSLLDVACGAGGALSYLSKIYHPKSAFLGIDINPKAVEIANSLYEKNGIKNCKVVWGDLFNPDLELIGKFDIVTILQALANFPDIEEPLKALASLNSKKLIFSTLLYEGDLTYKTKIINHNRRSGDNEIWSLDYNTYSINYIVDFLKTLGFSKIFYTPFKIDIDLHRYENGYETDSYTRKYENGDRVIMVGNFNLNWYFVYAKR